MPVSVWQLVYSKSGRDKGKLFIVLNVENEYAWLVDGQLRPVEKPKKKKLKHIQPINYFVDLSKNVQKGSLTNSDVKKVLAAYAKL